MRVRRGMPLEREGLVLGGMVPVVAGWLAPALARGWRWGMRFLADLGHEVVGWG